MSNLRVLITMCLLFYAGISEELHIDANKVFTDESKGTITAEGSVRIVKENDVLNADIVNIYIDEQRKPIKFEALNNVNFVVHTDDKRELKGKCNTLIYFIQENEYQLLGNAEVKEKNKPNFIKGEKITLNNKNGFANVESTNNAPVRVIIDLNDVQETKEKSQTNKESKTPKAQQINTQEPKNDINNAKKNNSSNNTNKKNNPKTSESKENLKNKNIKESKKSNKKSSQSLNIKSMPNNFLNLVFNTTINVS